MKVLTAKAMVPADAIRTFGLVPGQGMQATIYLLRAKDALSVANVAIESDDGRSYVQVRNGGDFKRREVTLGVRGTARSQVVKGLRVGDEVRLASGIAPDAGDDKADANGTQDAPAGDSGAAKS